MYRGIMLYGIIAIMVFAVSFTYAVEESDIVVYYSFDRLDEKKFVDESGNGNDAELSGSGRLVDGQFGKAVHLDGGIVQMVPANDFIVPIGEIGQITMEAWFYLNAHDGFDGIISIEAVDAGCCEFRIMVHPDLFPYWDAARHEDRSLKDFTFALKTWYHYVLVADGKDGKIYVDGKFIGSQPENFTFPKFKQAAIYIGAGETPNHHKLEDGIIDEVVIYSKALTEAEVKASMELGVEGALAVEAENKLTTTWGKIKRSF